MAATSVAFRAPDGRIRADTCEPLVKAAEAGRVRLSALGRGGYPGATLPLTQLREVRSIGVWDAARDQSWGLDWHRNEGIELTFLSSGALDFSLRDRSYQLRPLDLTITRPWQEHRVGNPNITSSRLTWVILDVGVRRPNQSWRWPKWLLLGRELIQELTELLRLNEAPVWRADKAVAACFERLSLACGEPFSLVQEANFKILLNELWLAVAMLLRSQRPPRDSYLPSSERTVALFLEELPARVGEPWTLKAMADACGIGRTCFTEYCEKITRLTPLRYLMRCRLEHACRLLRSPDRSVIDVAFASGFGSSQYFATAFAREFRVSPSEWRRRLQVADRDLSRPLHL